MKTSFQQVQCITKGFIGAFRRAQSGAILIMGAIILPVLLLAVGMAVEISNYSNAKSQFNHAVEEAVLAAAAVHAADPTAYARQYLDANITAQGVRVTVDSFVVQTDNTKWTGEAKGRLTSAMGSVMGVGEYSMQNKTIVEWDNSTTTELVAMVDVSGTMCANFKRTEGGNGVTAIDFVPDRNCTKLDMMEEALKEIVNTGTGYNQGGGVTVEPAYKVGILPFTYKVRVAHPANMPSFMLKGETDAGYPNSYFTDLTDADAGGDPIPAVTPLLAIRSEADKTTLINKVNDLSRSDAGSFNRQAWKRSALGAELSALMLDPRYNNVFGGEKPADFGLKNVEKVVIMMTDSANIGCCYTNYPADNFRNHYIYSYTPDHLHLVGDGKTNVGMCQQMKDAGIKIHTVLLDVDPNDMDRGGEDIVNAFSKCASDPSMAHTVPLGDTEKLKEVYNVIAQSLIKLRVTY